MGEVSVMWRVVSQSCDVEGLFFLVERATDTSCNTRQPKFQCPPERIDRQTNGWTDGQHDMTDCMSTERRKQVPHAARSLEGKDWVVSSRSAPPPHPS